MNRYNTDFSICRHRLVGRLLFISLLLQSHATIALTCPQFTGNIDKWESNRIVLKK